MEARRHNEINRLRSDIKTTQGYIASSESAIARFKHKRSDDTFAVSQIRILSDKIHEHEQRIVSLQEELDATRSGERDDAINAVYTQNTARATQKHKDTMQRRADNKPAQQPVMQKKPFSQQGYKFTERDSRYVYREFMKSTGLLPDHLARNLKDMPQNKGYIFRSVYFYGHKPPEHNKPTVVFERQRGGIMWIHEWTDREYKLFKKEGKQRKHLMEIRSRKPIVLPAYVHNA